MDENRLKEIIELANTVLPITGNIRNDFELKRETERAIHDLEMEPFRGCQHWRLLSELRFLHREAQQSIEANNEALSTDPNSDRGDHDLK